jgi:hypothetical protein
VQLAKLVIAKNLGKQKTIYLLWGVQMAAEIISGM